MDSIKDFFYRHSAWIIPGMAALILLKPAGSEFKTLLLIIAFECIAIALSGVAVYSYTKLNFVKQRAMSCIGFIFLGVHICIGLIVLGVYIAQFS